MADGHNFERLREAILSMSKASDWDGAKREWRLVNVWEAEERTTCLCGHHPIIQVCSIENVVTQSRAEVGNVCIKRFFGIRSDLVFDALKRIREDISKPLNADAATFFHTQGVVTDWEYGFLQDTKGKRAPSESQLEHRIKINKKVLRWMGRSRQ